MKRLPDHIDGYGAVRAFTGALPPPALVARATTRMAPNARGRDKLLADIDAAFVACGVADGATPSFHHHLRNGDQATEILRPPRGCWASRGRRWSIG